VILQHAQRAQEEDPFLVAMGGTHGARIWAERCRLHDKLEVSVDSVSDNRGMLGLGQDIPAGPLSIRIRVVIAADGSSPEQLRQIVEWAEARSPVGDAVRRAIPSSMEIEICQEDL